MQEARGFILPLALLILLAVTGFGAAGLALALAEERVSSAVFRRAVGDLSAEGELALSVGAGLSLPPGTLPSPSFRRPSRAEWISLGPERRWENAVSSTRLAWLGPEVALIQSSGGLPGRDPVGHAGLLAWRLDLPGWMGQVGSAAMGAGGGVTLAGEVAFAPDSCSAGVVVLPTARSLPSRWTAPFDLAVGWRGRSPVSAGELDGIRALAIPGLVVLDPGPRTLVADTLGPSVTVVPGDLRVGKAGVIQGVVYVDGSLQVESGGEVRGAVRVRRALTVLAGGRVVADPCAVARAWEATGTESTLRAMRPLRPILPL